MTTPQIGHIYENIEQIGTGLGHIAAGTAMEAVEFVEAAEKGAGAYDDDAIVMEFEYQGIVRRWAAPLSTFSETFKEA